MNAKKTIAVYGPGCKKCKDLKENVEKYLSEEKVEAEFEYITDMEKIIEMGIMTTPALIIDGTIVSSGKVLKSKDIAKLL